jgi:hypothetical protein
MRGSKERTEVKCTDKEGRVLFVFAFGHYAQLFERGPQPFQHALRLTRFRFRIRFESRYKIFPNNTKSPWYIFACKRSNEREI